MAEEKDVKQKNNSTENPLSKPDPETLHTTDPQDHMKGPISSLVQNVKHEVEDNEEKDKDDKNKK